VATMGKITRKATGSRRFMYLSNPIYFGNYYARSGPDPLRREWIFITPYLTGFS
jgi:hypothetical protein